jgi:type I restriction-modification system DNA methylase subunit
METIDKIKEIEIFLRQYGIEGEDAFITLTAFYLRIHNPVQVSNNLIYFRKKGEKFLQKLDNDIVLIGQLEQYVSKDIKGNSLPIAYQYFLSKKFRDNTGKFFTPQEVAESMADMLPIKENAVIFDPTCGGGTFLLSALKRWNKNKLTIIGNDIDKSLVYLSELLLLINNSNSQNSFEFNNYNLYSEFNKLKNHNGKVDYILANPPFSIPIMSLPVKSPLFDLGYNNSDALFIDLCYDLLKDNGKLVCLVPHSLVANKEFIPFRKEIEKRWTIKGVFILPEGVFNTTSSTTTRADVIVLTKSSLNTKTEKIVFGNISKVGVPITYKDKAPFENELKELLKTNKIKIALN